MREYKITERCDEFDINEMARQWRELYQIFTYTVVAHYSNTYVKCVFRRKVKRNRLKNLYLKIIWWLK